MNSSGNPEKCLAAKQVIKNAIIGLVLVLGAGTLALILSHAYGQVQNTSATSQLPILTHITPQPAGSGIAGVLIKAITGMLQTIIQAVAYPFMEALNYFTNSTPLMVTSSGVFALWLAVVGIADALMVLVIALLGFHVMSASSLGLKNLETRQLFPQIGVIFLLINTSIFAIDGIISISNAMIHALKTVFPVQSVWETLSATAP